MLAEMNKEVNVEVQRGPDGLTPDMLQLRYANYVIQHSSACLLTQTPNGEIQ